MKSVITLAVLLALVALGRAADRRPDIVFVYFDDLRWDALGVVQREQAAAARFPFLQTPNLDRLAAQSVRFRQSFVVTSLCSPGRAAVMTSRYGHDTGIIGNGKHLPTETLTFAKHLREAGYTTAYVGKWHMRDQRERPHYDYAASFVGQGRYSDCPFVVDGKETPTTGWVDDVSADFAVRFVEQQAKEKPFFLWLGFKSPHGPRGGANLPERTKSLYAADTPRPTPNTDIAAVYNPGGAAARPAETPRQNENQRDYLRHVTAVDAGLGRLLDALERSGRAGNTLVILTSDNGYYLGEHGLGDKRSAYDESLRVPLLVRLPNPGPSAATTREALVLNLDYAPTILDYAGAAPLPEARGRSLRPLLEARTPSDWRTAFFYEYFKEANFAAPSVLALRTATHKFSRYPGNPSWTEVFDLTADPYETKNLATAEPALTARLQAQFAAASQAAGFRWPEGFTADGAVPPAVTAPKKAGKKQKQ